MESNQCKEVLKMTIDKLLIELAKHWKAAPDERKRCVDIEAYSIIDNNFPRYSEMALRKKYRDDYWRYKNGNEIPKLSCTL